MKVLNKHYFAEPQADPRFTQEGENWNNPRKKPRKLSSEADLGLLQHPRWSAL